MNDFIRYIGNVSVLGNGLEEWGGALVTGVCVFLSLTLARALVARQHDKRENYRPWIRHILVALKKTKGFFVLALSFLAVAMLLKLPLRVETFVLNISIFAVFIQLAIWVDTVYRDWYAGYNKDLVAVRPAAATALGATRVVVSACIWACCLLLALDNAGINVTALITGLGIGGIALALAVQSTLGDLLASLSIVLDKPFVAGDFIVIDAYQGTVENVGLKTTRLRSISGEQLVFSNANLLKSQIRNYGRMYRRRVANTVGVPYHTTRENLESIPGIIREIVLSQQSITFDRVHFKSYGTSSLEFEYVYFVESADYNLHMDIQQAINFSLFRIFKEKDIDFAHPAQAVLIQKPAGSA